MRNRLFPTLVVDEFLDRPDELVDYAKTLEYDYDPTYRWPGKRTRPLHEINNDLFLLLGNKILSYYGNRTYSYTATAAFQIVDQDYYKGWIHRDTPTVLTSIIYLDKKNNYNSGTNLYTSKNFWMSEFMTKQYNLIKQDFLRDMQENKNYVMDEKVKNTLLDQHNFFEKTLEVKNLYNRLFSFESNLWHSADCYDNGNSEPRLTLVYFFEEINFENNRYPLMPLPEGL